MFEFEFFKSRKTFEFKATPQGADKAKVWARVTTHPSKFALRFKGAEDEIRDYHSRFGIIWFSHMTGAQCEVWFNSDLGDLYQAWKNRQDMDTTDTPFD